MNKTNDISPEELERIERFLTHEMPEDEAKAFELALTTDISLREKAGEVKLLLLGVNEVSLEERLERFHKEIAPVVTFKKNTRAVPLVRKLAVAASVLALVTLSLWWFLQNGNSNEKVYSKYYSPDPGLATVMSSTADYDFEKAMVEYKNGEYDKALKAWTSLLQQKPGNDTLTYFIGAAYQAKGDDDHVIENLQQVTADGNSAFYKDACWYLGLSYLKKGETQQAITYIEKSGYPQSEAVIKAINKK
ncbi:MAG: tetratricopeptide repeat protein [Chitinophagaceae bacterium]